MLPDCTVSHPKDPTPYTGGGGRWLPSGDGLSGSTAALAEGLALCVGEGRGEMGACQPAVVRLWPCETQLRLYCIHKPYLVPTRVFVRFGTIIIIQYAV